MIKAFLSLTLALVQISKYPEHLFLEERAEKGFKMVRRYKIKKINKLDLKRT